MLYGEGHFVLFVDELIDVYTIFSRQLTRIPPDLCITDNRFTQCEYTKLEYHRWSIIQP